MSCPLQIEVATIAFGCLLLLLIRNYILPDWFGRIVRSQLRSLRGRIIHRHPVVQIIVLEICHQLSFLNIYYIIEISEFHTRDHLQEKDNQNQSTFHALVYFRQILQNLKMSAILACLCCCCYEEQQKTTQPAQRQRQPSKKKKTTKVVRPRRIKTKYQKEDFVLVSDEDRHEKRVKAYCCPICTLYYTRILACSDCVNFICLNCFEGYENKMKSNKQKMKCPFCSSQKSYYCDYELDPHSYFDTTNKGFLPKEERSKLQAEMNSKKEEEEVKVEEENQENEEDGAQENHEEAVEEVEARE